MTNFLRVERIKCNIRAGLLVLFPFLLSSCVAPVIDRIGDTELDVEPVEKPAKGTFTVKVDGKTFTPIAQGVEFSWEKDEEGVNSLYIDAVDKDNSSVSLGILTFIDLSAETETVFDFTHEGLFTTYSSGKTVATSKAYSGRSGQLKFTKVSNKRITGEFEFIAEGYWGDIDGKVNLTEGKFDLYYD